LVASWTGAAERAGPHDAIRLSICIPTHEGRAAKLGVALDSILAQIGGRLRHVVEVTVSDNGSQDATRQVVAERQAARPGLIAYLRFEEDRGFTANLLQSVEMARGEFCWLFSSDDALVEGAVRRVLDLLHRHPDATGATLLPIVYDIARNVPGPRPLWPQPTPSPIDAEHRWTSVDDVITGCGLYMGILPAQVVRRDAWRAVAEELRGEPLGRTPLFPHLAVIYRMVAQQPVWIWAPGPTFHLRVGEPNSVLEQARGLTEYHLETTAETLSIAYEVLGHSSGVRGLVRDVWQAIFNPVALAAYKVHPAQTLTDDRRLAIGATRWFSRMPSFWLLSLPVLLLPHGLVRMLCRPLGRAVRRFSRA